MRDWKIKQQPLRRQLLLSRLSTGESTAVFSFFSTGCDLTEQLFRDGIDGLWSSFTIRVGTPAQNLRVFVSTASQETWVILPEGCVNSSRACAEGRGGLYQPNKSSTWRSTGQYTLYIEDHLALTGGGLFGNDTLGLGLRGSEATTLDHQIVGGIVTENFYLGMLGVNPKSTNFTSPNEGQLSYMSSLFTRGLIPSLSFGYTAGAQYRQYSSTCRWTMSADPSIKV